MSLFPSQCILCHSDQATPVIAYDTPDIYEQAIDIPAEGYARAWVKCDNCGFHYSRYSRPPEALDRLYETTYRSDSASWRRQSAQEVFDRVMALPPEESENLARISWLKDELATLQSNGFLDLAEMESPRHAVDVGGASGVFAAQFQDDAWRCTVVDPSPEGKFVEQHGVSYVQSAFPTGGADLQADLVSMIYTLEHVRDPAAVIAAAREILGSAGALFIEVPDANAFGRKPDEDDIFNSCHLWMFDPDSLTRLLTQKGFDVVNVSRRQAVRGHYALMVLARPAA